jgi:hypothetical protein
VRIRSVKPEFWSDRVTGRWDTEMKLVYIALWNLADDEGRFEYEPEVIRAQLFPYGCPFCLETVMARIAETRKLRLYSVEGLMYGAIPSFMEHQKPNRPSKSKLPAPPALSNHVPAVAQPAPAPITEDSVKPHGALTPGEEGRGEERRGTYATDDANEDPLAAWRHGLAEALCVMGANPLRVVNADRAKAMRQDIASLGVGEAVAVSAEAARDSGKVPGTADWFAPILRRAAEQGPRPPVRAPDECPRPGDPDFNDQDAWPDYESFLNRGRTAHA